MKILALLLLAFAVGAWSWSYFNDPGDPSPTGEALYESLSAAEAWEQRTDPVDELRAGSAKALDSVEVGKGYHGRDVESDRGAGPGSAVGEIRSAFGSNHQVEVAAPEPPRRSAFRQNWPEEDKP
ncbi:MAG: hypothetical protein JJU00_20155 [Opitutales bacterium]|nr:hypothetical protein [Opitutales bacterium]